MSYQKPAAMGFLKSSHAVVLWIVGLSFVAQFSVIDADIDIREPDYRKDKPSISKLGVYGKAAVAANGPECATVGKNILKDGGSAVDAAIATLLCDGVVSVHSMGLGGGFLMTIWNAEDEEAVCLNAREAAPAAAHATMFQNPSEAKFDGFFTHNCGRSIAVPGEIRGYWDAHYIYGKLPWKRLFEPTIEICERGSVVNQYIADSLREVQDYILEQPSMREILIDPSTNQTWTKGTRIRRPVLARTLRKLAASDDPVKEFYEGEMARKMVQEIRDMGGIMALSDFEKYRTKWAHPIATDLDGKTLYTVPPPGSGVILSFIMKILNELLPTLDAGVFWQRVVETFKWGYARRSEFGDSDTVGDLIENMTASKYVKYVRNSIRDDRTVENASFYGAEHQFVDDTGTANICVLAPDGSAVTVTSTINHYLGSMRRSPSTGIIFNDEMDDFSSPNFANGFAMPPSPANYIAPFKRPMSSMAPSILIDNSKKSVRMLVGAAGGTKITTAIATTMALHLYAGFDVKEAIDTRRIHHQLFPMVVDYEEGANPLILKHLAKVGHNVTSLPRMGSTVTAITVERDENNHRIIKANADGRREGNVDGF